MVETGVGSSAFLEHGSCQQRPKAEDNLQACGLHGDTASIAETPCINTSFKSSCSHPFQTTQRENRDTTSLNGPQTDRAAPIPHSPSASDHQQRGKAPGPTKPLRQSPNPAPKHSSAPCKAPGWGTHRTLPPHTAALSPPKTSPPATTILSGAEPGGGKPGIPHAGPTGPARTAGRAEAAANPGLPLTSGGAVQGQRRGRAVRGA